MMVTIRTFIVATALAMTLLLGCSSEEPPPRDYIPVLKARLFQLQEAVKDRNRAALDSLMSVQILDYGESADSLLRLAYGPDDTFDFRQFGLAEFTYTQDKARVDCFVMDSTQKRNRPLVLTYLLEGDRWLLKRFEAGKNEPDSTAM